ncbi:MAG: hypothetical protein IT406_02830 [Candidatus Yanofskybacteria bacterium]|nr:hypothetical protein [Candidatus Yanofskybacteria bacterium]
MTRFLKQLLYGGAFLAVLALIGWGAFRMFGPAPTCSDGVQNGREEGVDCGAVACGVLCPPSVQPLENFKPLLIRTGSDAFDVLAHLENPNGSYGAARVDYELAVRDAAGTVLARRTGYTYVNPAQPRYLLFPFRGLSSEPVAAELVIAPANVEWGALQLDEAGRVQFAVRSERLSLASTSVGYDAVVLNRSRFDFNEVDVAVMLFDSRGSIVGANTTIIRTLRSGEERAVSLAWPFPVPEAVHAQAIVTTNVFANDNFIRAYGSQERFQSY